MTMLESGNLKLDTELNRLHIGEEGPVRLTPKEAIIMKLLMENVGKRVTLGDFFAAAYPEDRTNLPEDNIFAMSIATYGQSQLSRMRLKQELQKHQMPAGY